jgi:hypothetical protein
MRCAKRTELIARLLGTLVHAQSNVDRSRVTFVVQVEHFQATVVLMPRVRARDGWQRFRRTTFAGAACGRKTMLHVIAIALTFFADAALADGWKEYKNRDAAFTVEFPGAPTIEATRYVTSDGRSFPARLFAVKQEGAEFKVTVVDMPGEKKRCGCFGDQRGVQNCYRWWHDQIRRFASHRRRHRSSVGHCLGKWWLFLRRAVLPKQPPLRAEATLK